MNKITVSIFSICIFLVSCSTEPQAINFGKDLCEHCSMTIMDKKFGAEMVNSKGKAIKFDSGECMVGYINSENKFQAEQYLVVNYASEGELINAEQSNNEFAADLLTWDDVKKINF